MMLHCRSLLLPTSTRTCPPRSCSHPSSQTPHPGLMRRRNRSTCCTAPRPVWLRNRLSSSSSNSNCRKRTSRKRWGLLKTHEQKYHCRARLNASDRQPICVVMHPSCCSCSNCRRPTHRRQSSHPLRCGSRYPSTVRPWCARKAK